MAGMGLGEIRILLAGGSGSPPSLCAGALGTSRSQLGQLQAKLWTNRVGQRHTGGRQGQTHPQDVGRELVEVLHALWYGFIRPHWLLFLQQEEKETPAGLKSKAPGSKYSSTMRGRGLESRDLGEMPPVSNVPPVNGCQHCLPSCLTFILSPIVLLHRFFSLFKLSARNLPRKQRGGSCQPAA